MKSTKKLFLAAIFPFLLLSSSGAVAARESQTDVCPLPTDKPEEILIDTNHQAEERTPFVDNSRPIKDLGTDFVVKKFFSTPDTLFNFMKVVYETLDKSLQNYKEIKGLEDNAITLIFKGGNVLRMVFNGALALLPTNAADLLREAYAPDFKRSDADFSVYIDENKLKDLTYDDVINEIAEQVSRDLNSIRKEFKKNPGKYFNFLALKPEEAQKELAESFKELSDLPIVSDKENKEWYGAKFKQIQLLDDRSPQTPACKYFGQFDYRFIGSNGKIIGIPLTEKRDWIVNTDNRTLEWPMGNILDELIKFYLLRSKVAFEYAYMKNGKIVRKVIGGELIDVSIPHRKDSTLEEFFKKYGENVVSFRLISPTGESIHIKTYSRKTLAHDLLTILFRQFDRPWNGGPKYTKRVNRLFFLASLELMFKYGLGSQGMKDYVSDVKKDIIPALTKLYPIGADSPALARELKQKVQSLIEKFSAIDASNTFWSKTAQLVEKELIGNPQKADADELKNMVEIINKNLEIMEKLSDMEFKKLEDPSAIYNADIGNLF